MNQAGIRDLGPIREGSLAAENARVRLLSLTIIMDGLPTTIVPRIGVTLQGLQVGCGQQCIHRR
jgi:hypothetical protein